MSRTVKPETQVEEEKKQSYDTAMTRAKLFNENFMKEDGDVPSEIESEVSSLESCEPRKLTRVEKKERKLDFKVLN